MGGIPVSSPACEILERVNGRFHPVQRSLSVRRRRSREKLKPQLSAAPPAKFSAEKGILKIASQPVAVRRTATSQTVSQSRDGSLSSVTRPSTRTPLGFVEKKYALRRSWYVSMTRLMRSSALRSASRRSSCATNSAAGSSITNRSRSARGVARIRHSVPRVAGNHFLRFLLNEVTGARGRLPGRVVEIIHPELQGRNGDSKAARA